MSIYIWIQYSYTDHKNYKNHHSRSNLQRITAPNSVAATRLRLSGPNCTELILPHRALPEHSRELRNWTQLMLVLDSSCCTPVFWAEQVEGVILSYFYSLGFIIRDILHA